MLRHVVWITLLLWIAAGPVCADFDLHVRLLDSDPKPGESLEVDQQLFFRVGYESDVPLVFTYSAYSRGRKLEYGFYTGYPELQKPGQSEALGWIGFTNVTHIDEVHIEILNAQREKIGELVVPFSFSWTAPASVSSDRKKPQWVEQLERHENWLRGNMVDPFATKQRMLRDWLFYLNVASVPIYLLLQAYMLHRYRGRWRDLASVPLVSLLPLVLASIVGFGMELRYWIVFIFRGTPFALSYLLFLWWFRYRSQKDAAEPGRN